MNCGSDFVTHFSYLMFYMDKYINDIIRQMYKYYRRHRTSMNPTFRGCERSRHFCVQMYYRSAVHLGRQDFWKAAALGRVLESALGRKVPIHFLGTAPLTAVQRLSNTLPLLW